MIQVDLRSTKVKPRQFYGGPFDIKQIRAHADAVEIELEPSREYHGINSRIRKWQSGRVYISNEDVPRLVSALVDQLNQFRSELEKLLAATTERPSTREMYEIFDSHLDINWGNCRDLIRRSSAKQAQPGMRRTKSGA